MNWKRYVLMNEASVESTGTPTAGGASSEATAAAESNDTVDASGPSALDVELFGSEGDGDETVAEKPAPAKPAVDATAKPVAEAAKPAVTPAAASPVVAAPATAPAAAAAPTAESAKPVVQAAETPEAKTAREAAEKAEEAKMFAGLVEYYKLPEDMASKLATEPENVLPQLAARVHQAVAKGVQHYLSNHLAAQLPKYILHIQAVSKKEDESKASFYGANPDLKDYEAQVLQAGQLYRSMNPTAGSKTAIEAIGNIVRSSLGLKPLQAAVPVIVKPAPGFTPAGGGGTGRGAAPSADDNEFTRMSSELD